MNFAPRQPILAIESSCDETACAIVRGTNVLSSVVASQVDIHANFGGVVPELASRQHLDAIVPCVTEALKEAALPSTEVSAIAVTEGPGLIGALLIGVQAARGLALTWDIPAYGVHHLEGHLYSVLLDQDLAGKALPPHLALLVSGGHTQIVDVAGPGRYRILASTRDDAVGEAFDKAAKMLGIGYPGGPIIDKLAQAGNPTRHNFPRAMLAPKTSLEFSFSGLKTSLLTYLERAGQPQSVEELSDLCASFQAAIVDVLVEKIRRALDQHPRPAIHVVGGVAANRQLRAGLQRLAHDRGIAYRAAPMRYCGDNAAMIGAAAQRQIDEGVPPRIEVHTQKSIERGCRSVSS